jgi:hypothetical protein
MRRPWEMAKGFVGHINSHELDVHVFRQSERAFSGRDAQYIGVVMGQVVQAPRERQPVVSAQHLPQL